MNITEMELMLLEGHSELGCMRRLPLMNDSNGRIEQEHWFKAIK